jgi:hypothetical protein
MGYESVRGGRGSERDPAGESDRTFALTGERAFEEVRVAGEGTKCGGRNEHEVDNEVLLMGDREESCRRRIEKNMASVSISISRTRGTMSSHSITKSGYAVAIHRPALRPACFNLRVHLQYTSYSTENNPTQHGNYSNEWTTSAQRPDRGRVHRDPIMKSV